MELNEHKFIRKLIADRVFFYRNKTPSIKSSFCIQTHIEVEKIKKTLTDLKLIRQFIAEIHPYGKIETNSSIRPDLQLKYHIENYFLRIMTYKDQLMKLIIVIYQWEIKSAIGLEKRLIKKAKIENIPSIAKLILDINKMLSSVREIRNKLTHEGTLNNVDVMLLEIQSGLEDFIDKNPFLNFKKEEFFDSDLKSNYLALSIMENINEMMQIEEDMATNLFINLDFLYQQYILIIPEEHTI